MVYTIIYFITTLIFPLIAEKSEFVTNDPSAKYSNYQENKQSREELITYIDSINNRGRDLSRINRELSLEYANIALSLSVDLNYQKGMGNAYRVVAMTNYHANNYSIALEYINKAVDIFEEIDDADGIADTKISIGYIYYNLNQKEYSLKNHQEAYDHYKKGGRIDRIGIAGHNLAQSLILNDSLSQANNIIDKTLSIAEQINDIPLLTACYILMAKISEKEDKLDDAKTYYEKTLEHSSELGNEIHKGVIIESLVSLAEIYKSKNELDKPLKYLEEAKIISQQEQISSFIHQIYSSFIEVHLLKGNVDSAKYYLKEYLEITKSFENERKNDLAKTTFDILATREVEKEKLELLKINKEREERLRNISFLTVFSIVTIILLFIYIIKSSQVLKKEKNLNQIKSKIVSIISHELRTPLATISSSVEILKHYTLGISNTQAHQKSSEQIDKINRQIDRLKLIINDVLLLEKSQNDKFKIQIENFELTQYINSILEDFEEADSELRPLIKIGFDNTIEVNSDKILLYHILTNLLSNAYKYSPMGKSPEIHLAENNHDFIIKVVDYGIGIPIQDQPYLYDVFFRGKNASHIKGTGIGLPVVKMFTDRLKGKIEVHSEVNKGSVFTIYIPKNIDN